MLDPKTYQKMRLRHGLNLNPINAVEINGNIEELVHDDGVNPHTMYLGEWGGPDEGREFYLNAHQDMGLLFDEIDRLHANLDAAVAEVENITNHYARTWPKEIQLMVHNLLNRLKALR